jgi:hypothetical protein
VSNAVTQYVFAAGHIVLAHCYDTRITMIFCAGVATMPGTLLTTETFRGTSIAWDKRFTEGSGTPYSILDPASLRALIDDLTRALGPCKVRVFADGKTKT